MNVWWCDSGKWTEFGWDTQCLPSTVSRWLGEPFKMLENQTDTDVLAYLQDAAHFPISIKFGRPPLRANERIMLASTFHSLYAISAQLSPEQNSSGILSLDTDVFRLHCLQVLLLRSIDWLTRNDDNVWLNGQLIDWLIDWCLLFRMVGRSIDRLIDWSVKLKTFFFLRMLWQLCPLC